MSRCAQITARLCSSGLSYCFCLFLLSTICYASFPSADFSAIHTGSLRFWSLCHPCRFPWQKAFLSCHYSHFKDTYWSMCQMVLRDQVS